MARRDEAWLKNYEDVEFELPGLGGVGERPGSWSPTELAPMLPPKTYKVGVSGEPPVAGGRQGATSQPPTLAPPVRIPRSHSSKALPSSPLNPQHTASTTATTATTTSTTSSMPLSSPFGHGRSSSRASAYFSRIASEEARAFGSTPSANPALASRGSMILYRVADPFANPSATNSGTNTPISHNSLKGLVAADHGTLPLPDARNRASIYSTSGESILSLASDSKYPNLESQRSGLIAYVYDPETDEPLDDDDEVDWLHDPENTIAEKLAKQRGLPASQRPAFVRPPKDSSLSWRGFLNVTVLLLLIVTILALFIAYPTVATLNDGGRNKLIALNTRINSTGQAVDPNDAPAPAGGGDSSSSTGVTSTSTTSAVIDPTSTTTSTTTTRAVPTTTDTTTTTTSDNTLSSDALQPRQPLSLVWDSDRKLWVSQSDKESEDDLWWAVEKDTLARKRFVGR